MLSNLQLSRTIREEKVTIMDVPHKAVSNEAMLTEWKIIQQAQLDPTHFRPLYDKYYRSIFRFIYQRIGTQAPAADVCSQVFLKAMQKLNKYQFKGVPFSAWLYRIASNEVAQHFRDNKKSRTVCVDDRQLNDIIDEVNEQPNEQLTRNLLTCLDNLKPLDLQLIELRFFEKRPFKEIADILGITESNAKVKTYRILERLKNKLIELPLR
ncbi:MAG: RNA polymerase sigma-70 factor (ECF subfamily) [Polaribacter sp.]|jgi:RNA polymerase sigma-70 factor (ECF subfamily)